MANGPHLWPCRLTITVTDLPEPAMTLPPDVTPIDPPGAPPGTVALGFWQRAGTRTAIVATVGLVLAVFRGWLVGVPVSREALAIGMEGVVWAWLAAGGIAVVAPGAIRRA